MTYPIDWTTAYDNRGAVPGAEAIHARWVAEAAAFRERHPWRALTYGPGPREVVDLFTPEGDSAGLAVFVHGGYWHRNDQRVFSHLAAGALARGWPVALTGYPLCPDVRVTDIVRSVAAAVAAAATDVPGPIRLAGHSAGGHLVSRMMCVDMASRTFADRLAGVLSISGLHDLRPIRRTPLQSVLAMREAEADAESPALCAPLPGIPLTAWVGGEELPELRRQSALLANIWTGFDVPTRFVEDPGHDHFSVIEPLADPDSPILDAWLGGA